MTIKDNSKYVSKRACGPFMLNRVFANIEQVIDFYDKGGGIDRHGNNELKPLSLSKKEKYSLKVFLTDALTGDEITVRRPDIP